MAQVTWRGDDLLLDRVRQAAAAQGWSVNAWMTRVFDAATNPELGGSDLERVRERLRLAGLLETAATGPKRPDPKRLARARRAAGQGAYLSDLLVDDRQ